MEGVTLWIEVELLRTEAEIIGMGEEFLRTKGKIWVYGGEKTGNGGEIIVNGGRNIMHGRKKLWIKDEIVGIEAKIL